MSISVAFYVPKFSQFESHQQKKKTKNLSLYSPYYAEACNELAVPNTSVLRDDSDQTERKDSRTGLAKKN